ncbi:hypothetical protein SAMN02745165_01755 [Malonomonas rubra DSM 5091]|uniref:DUF4124 domain-containing protein n=1 Tax=Malonomonas rubra DSM 5091 TaxID=1122189 RepID=A0A1M6HA65_MALRU|nr:hypothetical protein [Malonomonas rubra]SHJ19130.1 hypothetical protein SAMN02745165_01755 [Malonomonas rubra DSM 5091]
MFKLLKLFGWMLFFLIAVVAFDQFLLRVPLDYPGLKPAQTFYVDFRSRLLDLVLPEKSTPLKAESIEQVIEQNTRPAQQTTKPQRYLYVDKSGVLQFADSLQQVPVQYRESAQPLAD